MVSQSFAMASHSPGILNSRESLGSSARTGHLSHLLTFGMSAFGLRASSRVGPTRQERRRDEKGRSGKGIGPRGPSRGARPCSPFRWKYHPLVSRTNTRRRSRYIGPLAAHAPPMTTSTTIFPSNVRPSRSRSAIKKTTIVGRRSMGMTTAKAKTTMACRTSQSLRGRLLGRSHMTGPLEFAVAPRSPSNSSRGGRTCIRCSVLLPRTLHPERGTA